MALTLARSWNRLMPIFVVLMLCVGAFAQGGTGELTGLVTDPTGAVVADAPLKLTNSATGEIRTTNTTAAGTYRFPALQVVGTYAMEVSAKGFKTTNIQNIVITVGTIVSRDVKLELGANTEQVTVEAGTQLVQTEDSSLSQDLDHRIWTDMPLETRSQNEFIGLLPGAIPAAQANIGGNMGGTDRGAAVNGSRSGTGDFLVEGFDNNDQGQGGGGTLVGPGGANTTISPDAIQEYRVIEHVAPAEYGRAGGFVTDTVLKSGTNQWHGSLFEYNRIQALAANNWFTNNANEQDHLVRNQFGGSVGGPIIKDKTFFYFTTEFHRLRVSTPLNTTAVTSSYLSFAQSPAFEQWAEGTGVYVPTGSEGALGITGPCVTITGAACPGAFPNAILSAANSPIFTNLSATQPFGICTVGAANCTIAPSTLSSGGFNGAGAYTGGAFGFTPSVYPVNPYGTLIVAQPSLTNQARYTTKVDHKIGPADQINAAFLYDNADSDTQFLGGEGLAGPSEPVHGRAQNAGVTWSHTFSPTILNQARMSYTRHTANFPGDPSANAAGIPAIATAIDPLSWGFGNSSALPQFFTENAFVYKDDLSVTHGKHNFKGGASYERTRNGSSFESDYNSLILPNSIEDLITDMKFDDNADMVFYGAPTIGSIFDAEASINPTITPAVRPQYYRGFRANEFAAYLQDDWRTTSRLTLNLGLRWDYFGPPHNFQPGIDSNLFTGSNVTPFPYSPSGAGNPFIPLNNPTLAGYATGSMQIRNNDIWNKDTGDFGPRIGFSWDAMGNQKAVIRGGYGIAYDRMYNNIFENLRFNPPYFCFCGFGADVNGTPGGSLETPGIYSVPYTSANTELYNSPTLFPNGLPQSDPRAISQNLRTAYYEQAFLGVQYQIAKDMVLETNYVGTFGHRLIGVLNENTYPGRLACSSPPYAAGTPCADAGFAAGFDSSRPNPNFQSINLRTNCCNSNYEGLQVTLRKRFARGLQFNANYTYSKALDEISDAFTPRQSIATGGFTSEDSFNPHLDYGPSDFDVKHRVVVSYDYEVPLAKVNRWLGGWSTSGIVTFQTGSPFTLVDSGVDTNQDGEFGDRLQYVGTGAESSSYTHASPGATGYFNTGNFAPVACPATVNDGLWCEGPAVGQVNRGSLYGPRYFNMDVGLRKTFKINERAGVQFQANFFNVFNHPNFEIPVGDANNPKFGFSTAAFDPRIGQLALRFDF